MQKYQKQCIGVKKNGEVCGKKCYMTEYCGVHKPHDPTEALNLKVGDIIYTNGNLMTGRPDIMFGVVTHVTPTHKYKIKKLGNIYGEERKTFAKCGGFLWSISSIKPDLLSIQEEMYGYVQYDGHYPHMIWMKYGEEMNLKHEIDNLH